MALTFFRRQAAPASAESVALEPRTARDVRDAYKRGRREALQGRKRRPAGMTFLFLAAAVGVAVVAYAAYSGSFSGGGRRLDWDLAVPAD